LLFFAEAYRAIYYYHGDHLGSSNYITDRTGRVFEHTIYLPYGETWIDEGHETSLLGYKFTGKELDEETGLYYFGARYYDPQVSQWISTDPALKDYMPTGAELFFPEQAFNANSLKGAGGIYNSLNINLYHYAGLNPLKYVDPDGRALTMAEYKKLLASYDSDGRGIVSRSGNNWLINSNPSTCAIRLSNAFNKAGIKLPSAAEIMKTVKNMDSSAVNGKEGTLILSSKDMGKYLTSKYGDPTQFVVTDKNKAEVIEKIKGKIGMIEFAGGEFGHVDLLKTDKNDKTIMQGNGNRIEQYINSIIEKGGGKGEIRIWEVENGKSKDQ